MVLEINMIKGHGFESYYTLIYSGYEMGLCCNDSSNLKGSYVREHVIIYNIYLETSIINHISCQFDLKKVKMRVILILLIHRVKKAMMMLRKDPMG